MFDGSSLTPELLKRLELMSFRTKRAFLGSRQGGHVSPRKGHGIEFSDYRQYELGDNPRHIDWGLYARTDRLYVRRYQEEQDLTVLILCDSSASMFFPQEDQKWAKLKDVALAFSYLALMNQDGVLAAALGRFFSPRYYGAKAIHAVARDIDAIREPAEYQQRSFSNYVADAASRVRFPGIAILISDFLLNPYEIEQAINVLRSKNLSTVAIQILGARDEIPLNPGEDARCIDSETGEEIELNWDASTQKDYTANLKMHNDRLRSFCHSAGVHFTQYLPSTAFEEFLFLELPRSGILE